MSTEKSSSERSRFPEFYKLSVSDRIRAVHERGWLSAEDYQALISGEHTLKIHKADKMIENVVGVMGLPVGLGLNFLVNGRDYVVPLVVEEPSIVAALSSAATGNVMDRFLNARLRRVQFGLAFGFAGTVLPRCLECKLGLFHGLNLRWRGFRRAG